MSRDIIIIGNGISGITAARNCRKNSKTDRITVISAESEHFFSRTALMYIYMGHMKYEHTKPYEDWFWDKNGINLIKKYVLKVDAEKKVIYFENKEQLSFDILILATGSKPNKFGWPGQELKGVQGLYSLQDLQLMEENTLQTKKAVIVGGGLIGVEMAEMFQSRDIQVTFLVRETQFWDNVLPEEEAILIGRHIKKHHIDLNLETELKEIIGVIMVRVKAVLTNKGKTNPCDFVGFTTGVSDPNIDFLKESGN